MPESWHPNKRLSQNFLINTSYAQRIVDLMDISSEDILIEIGPGKGVLTDFILAAKPGRLILVELDNRWVEHLKTRFGHGLEIVQTDFLKYNWHQYFDQPVKIIGNIPYHITSPIIFNLIDHYQSVKSAVLMVQNEVCQRIYAKPGSKSYGILSVIAQTYADVIFGFRVSKGNFHPVPKVDSAVFRMDFYKTPENVLDQVLFRKIVRATFNYRRKMLRNSLGRIFEKRIVYSLNAVNIDRRPEDLTVDEFKSLSNEIYHLKRSADA